MQKADGSARWGSFGLDQLDFDDDSYDDTKFAVLHEEEEEEEDDENDVLPAEVCDDWTQPAQHQDQPSDVPPLADENAGQHAVDRGAASSSSQLFSSLSPSDRLLIEEACRTPPSAASTGHSPDRIPTPRHPRRPRALSYDSGLAEWTVRLQRYSQGDDEYDPDDDADLTSGGAAVLGHSVQGWAPVVYTGSGARLSAGEAAWVPAAASTPFDSAFSGEPFRGCIEFTFPHLDCARMLGHLRRYAADHELG